MRRHIDGGRGENAHVGDQPFQTVFAEQADAVAGLNAGIDKGGGTGESIGAVLGPADVVVEAVAFVAQGRARPQTLGLTMQQLGEVAVIHG